MFGLTPSRLTSVLPQQTTPANPFLWQQGGGRLTPEDLAMRRRMAMQNIAAGMDTSPVASWTQGAARVAQALVGNLQQGRLDKVSAQNAAASQAALGALGTGGDEASIARILADPYLDDGVKEVAKLKWQATHRAPVQPSEFERALQASGVLPGTPEWQQAMQRRVSNQLDPFVNTQLPGGGFYSGPRSLFEAQLGGGDQPSGTPGAVAPPASQSGPANFADYASARAMVTSMGAQGFLAWQGKHGVGVRVSSPEEMAALPKGTKVISPDGREGIKQ